MNEDQKNKIRDILKREGISHVVHSLSRSPLGGVDRFEISTTNDLPEKVLIEITIYDCIIQQVHTNAGHYLKIF